ncbi:MAG: hypothetical protein U1F34_04075 [Gammaproteobacteria bacterium]
MKPGVLVDSITASVNAVILGGMWLILPTGPIAAAIIARDGSYLRHYWRSLRASAEHLGGIRRGRPIARAVERWLVRANAADDVIAGSCTHCGKCCLDRSCIFLRFDENGHSRCQIYRTTFWSWLPCGEYPLNGDEIAQYACPSFSAMQRRVIPIHAVAMEGHGDEASQRL